jgi:hypothetical protein
MAGPKYDGKYLHSIVRELLGETRVSQALQNIVIPTFDIKLLQPTVFSRYDVRVHICTKYICDKIGACMHDRRCMHHVNFTVLMLR